jgi:RHS repeat-associated protein
VGLTRTSGGTFRLNFGGETTEPIAYNATTAAIESALEALSTIDNVAVGGSPGAYTVTFQGTQSATDVEPLTVEAAGLTNGSIERMLTYGYDAASQLILAEDPAARYTYQYDGLGRLASQSQEIAGLTPLIEYQSQFDLAGNRTELTALLGGSVDFQNTYTYDDLHRLTSLQQQAGGSGPGANAVAEKRVDFAYNAASQITQLTRYADTSGLEFVAHTFYAYDGIGRLTKLLHTEDGSLPGSGWGTDPLAGYAYAYDAASRITSIDSLLDGLTEYDHDDTNQLTSADHTSQTDETYTYDANGNRTMSGYSTTDNNQLTTDGLYNYTYDDEGNRLTRTKISDGYVTRYEWDHRNRLVGVIEEDDEENVLSTVEHNYDAFNRWVRRAVDADGPGGDPAEETFFSWEADQINLEFAGDGATDLSQRYLWSPAAIDQILAVEEVDSLLSAGDVIWPLTDHLGTPRDLASYDSGTNETTLENHRVFDSFGNLVSQTNGSFTIDVGFTGVYSDTATGLNYHRNRWYDMRAGRWVSEDPIWFAARDSNIVRYVGNASDRFTDPSGLVSPTAFYDVWTPEQREQWFKELWDRYGTDIEGSAKANCVPTELLAAVIANEMIDYPWFERPGELLGRGNSLGPAQIHIRLAEQYSLVPYHDILRARGLDIRESRDWSEVQRGLYMLRARPSGQYSTQRKYLNNNRSNIYAAGKLMRIYLDELNGHLHPHGRWGDSPPKFGMLPADFRKGISLTNHNVQQFSDQIRSRGKTCDEIVSMNVDAPLLAAMQALFNDGDSVLVSGGWNHNVNEHVLNMELLNDVFLPDAIRNRK